MLNRRFVSTSHDPRLNLAMEERLTREVEKGEVILFLWQNANTVVIGRNQNPYKECNLKSIEEDGVILIRRLSGGGAVFHDLGNLNFSFIAQDGVYSLEKNLQVILEGLKEYGIDAEFSGRNDITFEEKKFSGNAFSRIGSANCHHGTILMDVDMSRLGNYLNVPKLKMEAKGIASVKSRVTNLKPYAQHMNAENLMEALFRSFEKVFGPASQIEELDESFLEGKDYARKYQEWSWSIGASPAYSVHLEKKFDWGLVDFYFDVQDGFIRTARVFTDALIVDEFRELESKLQGIHYRKSSLKPVISQIEKEGLRKDLLEWIESEDISQ